jgi:hypothetical protein
MLLSHHQRQVLKICRRFRDQGGPRLVDFLGQRFALYVAIILLVGPALYLGGAWWLAAFVVGLLLGRLRVDLANALMLRQQWPTIAHLVDWQRVDHLIGPDQPAQSAAGQ